MHLHQLQLLNYRNHRDTTVSFAPGITIIQGLNAQGKTNIVESICYLTLGKSHRTSNNAALLAVDADMAIIRAQAVTDHGDPLVVAAELRKGKRRIAVQNNVKSRFADGIGVIRSVLLGPEDLLLVRGEPKIRRTYLDDTLSVRKVRYAEVLKDATHALRQRNAMLQDDYAFDQTMFNEWTNTWLRSAAIVVSARIALIHALQREITDIYTELVEASPAHDTIRLPKLAYEIKNGERIMGDPLKAIPNAADIQLMLYELLQQTKVEERRRRLTVVGPQRDDLYIALGDLPAKDFASHGEQWSLTLGLKLAAGIIIAETGDNPILLLDDVFADLDDVRRTQLLARCTQFDQVIITMASELPIVESYPHIYIHNGTITSQTP